MEELTADAGGDNVAAAVEEEEARDDDGLDQHEEAGGGDHEQAGDVQRANDIKDDVRWTSQVLRNEDGHGVVDASCSFSEELRSWPAGWFVGRGRGRAE